MAKGIVVVVAVAALATGGYFTAVGWPEPIKGYVTRWFGPAASAGAQAPQGPRPVSSEITTAVKKDMPVLLEGIGNVTTMASVAVKSRLDNEIVGVHFADGARVNKGDLLFTLDTRATEAQMRQVEGK